MITQISQVEADNATPVAIEADSFYPHDMARDDKKISSTAVKIGIAGAVAFGAVVSGFLVSRQGRRFVKDVWQGRRRTPLEDRALDAIWGDRMLGRRKIEVQEIEPGVLALIGQVRNTDERRWARALVARIHGVNEIEDRLEIGKAKPRGDAERRYTR